MNTYREIIKTLEAIDRQIEALEDECQNWAMTTQVPLTVFQAKDTSGRPMLADLLITRANLLIALSNIPRPTIVNSPVTMYQCPKRNCGMVRKEL